MADPRQIVLTGVSRGLGRSMAAEFVAAGHQVAGCARSARAVESLDQQFASPHRFDVVDVADDSAVAAWAADVLASFGAVDLIVNNAAMMNRNAPLWEVPAAEFSDVVDVNVKGTMNVIRHFLPSMLSRGSGVVVNFSSGWGRSVAPEVAPYCATKWAIEGLTRALAEELPPGMAAVPLNPGVINTEMLQSCFGAAASAYPDPDEWAQRAVPFILGITSEHNGEPLAI